jgi:hypothetical protein
MMALYGIVRILRGDDVRDQGLTVMSQELDLAQRTEEIATDAPNCRLPERTGRLY